MAWNFNQYEEEPDNEARLTMLRQHITEVTEQIQADLSGDGRSVSAGVLQDYLTNVVTPRRIELEKAAGSKAPSINTLNISGG